MSLKRPWLTNLNVIIYCRRFYLLFSFVPSWKWSLWILPRLSEWKLCYLQTIFTPGMSCIHIVIYTNKHPTCTYIWVEYCLLCYSETSGFSKRRISSVSATNNLMDNIHFLLFCEQIISLNLIICNLSFIDFKSTAEIDQTPWTRATGKCGKWTFWFKIYIWLCLYVELGIN